MPKDIIVDIMWKSVADFMTNHLDPDDKIAGPPEFNEIIGPLYTDTLVRSDNSKLFIDYKTIELDWFILHKGKMDDIDHDLLIRLYRKYEPVFANDVFIIFTKSDKGIEIMDKYSNHYKSFVEKIEKICKYRNILPNNIKKLYHKFSEIDKIYLGDYKALSRTIFGHKIIVDTRDVDLAPHILLDGYWEMWITRVFLDILREGMNIVEVGANIGYYSLLSASKIGDKGKLFAFEADPQVFDILHRNILINGFLNRVELVNKAVIDKQEMISFNKRRRFHGSGSIAKPSDEFLKKLRDDVEIINAEAISLDEYFKDKNVKIDIIKIDAEGSEPYIFDGMKKLVGDNPNIIIICEFGKLLISSAKRDPRKFLEDISQYGFHLKYIDDRSNIVEASIDKLIEKGGCELYLEK